jgi:hypothetical protein
VNVAVGEGVRHGGRSAFLDRVLVFSVPVCIISKCEWDRLLK